MPPLIDKVIDGMDQVDATTRLPLMPFFVGDFLASTATWTGEEQALYLLLLAIQWSSGPLPPFIDKLAHMVRYPPKRFDTFWRARVAAKFEVTKSGLVNRRLEKHREKAQAIARINHLRAVKAAQAKYGNPPRSGTAAAPSTPPWKSNGSSKHSSEEE
jgi:uncharacterized protein YdaU (DUF1376 family)